MNSRHRFLQEILDLATRRWATIIVYILLQTSSGNCVPQNRVSTLEPIPKFG